jgi:hypothetical protein
MLPLHVMDSTGITNITKELPYITKSLYDITERTSAQQ